MKNYLNFFPNLINLKKNICKLRNLADFSIKTLIMIENKKKLKLQKKYNKIRIRRKPYGQFTQTEYKDQQGSNLTQ